MKRKVTIIIFAVAWFAAVAVVPAQGATSFSYTSTAGIKYKFSTEQMTATVGYRDVLSGIWSAGGCEETFDASASDISFGEPTGISLARVASNSVRVTQEYRAFKTVTTWQFSGEDAHITFVVSNLRSAKPVRVLGFSGITINFNKVPDGFLRSWHWTYLRKVGVDLMHPSLWVPIGAAWASDDEIGFSAYTRGRLDKPKLIHASFEADGVIPAVSKLQYFVPESLERGESKTFDLHLRISTDRTWQHLLTPYRDAFRAAFPAARYKHQEKPLFWFSAVDQTWVRDDNPCGFGDNGGQTIWRRLDKADGAAAFLTTVADAWKAKGTQGCIFWAPNGYDRRGCMYRPDFDVFRPEVAANIPALAKGFSDRGLLFGMCARPGEGVDRTDWEHDSTFRLSAQSPEQMTRLLARFKRVQDLGFNLFYLDSFGADYNDLLIMRRIRPQLGTIPTYAEYASDLMLVESGRYLEHRDGGFAWTTPEQLSIQRWLVDGAGFIVKNLDNAPVDKAPMIEFKAIMYQDWTYAN
jgi:hypothetical protein